MGLEASSSEEGGGGSKHGGGNVERSDLGMAAPPSQGYGLFYNGC